MSWGGGGGGSSGQRVLLVKIRSHLASAPWKKRTHMSSSRDTFPSKPKKRTYTYVCIYIYIYTYAFKTKKRTIKKWSKTKKRATNGHKQYKLTANGSHVRPAIPCASHAHPMRIRTRRACSLSAVALALSCSIWVKARLQRR